jgi:hypothetical protein
MINKITICLFPYMQGMADALSGMALTMSNQFTSKRASSISSRKKTWRRKNKKQIKNYAGEGIGSFQPEERW